MTAVRVDDLRKAAALLFDHLERSVDAEIKIDSDFYWEVPKDARYDSYSEPKEFTVGQLSEDVGQVLRIAQGESEPIGYGLVWLAQVLRRIGEDSPG
ncbi:MAG: hypothetical protein AAGD10_14900 [Myxococcota bacterium]